MNHSPAAAADTGGAPQNAATVCLVTDTSPGPAVRHGLEKLREAIAARGAAMPPSAATLAEARGSVAIVAGLAGGQGQAAALCRELKLDAPAGAEALRVHRTKRGDMQVLLVCGSDDRGLMYALLDVARLVGCAASPADVLSEVKDVAEKPAVSERALSKYTMQRAYFESYFHDPAYWAEYLDTLAASRFNTFVLIFGYENGGYFAPPYPYFVDAAGFDGVRVVGYSAERQKRNVESLNRIIRMTHDRGMNFTLGIWDHIYRGGVQGPTADARKPTPGLVWGLTQDNLVAYTNAALAGFLQEIRGIDAIQFRMHGESGLKRGEMDTFWTNVFRVMNQHAKGMRFDARAKEFPDSLIDKALQMGVPMRICTKYWAEQMGMPFHPTHVNVQDQHNRRHGYADLLRYPQRYKMDWRLWNGGTTRVLLWGDPEYVRRFADSTRLYDGDGYEVNEPLATKMQDHPHDEQPFDLMPPARRYYTYEFERYWHFFQVFGRVGYNPDTAAELWDREFERRFGREAGPLVERGLHAASWVLPRINACVFPYSSFPTTRGWAEMQRRGDLPQYAAAEASDTEQFLNMREAARLHLEGKTSAKVWPEQTARWFAATAAEVLRCADEAEKCVGDKRSKEFDSTMADLRILANLSEFHARRIPAGLAWCRYTLTKDPAAMDEAINCEARAMEAWERIVAAAGDFYAKDLKFGNRGAGLSGHWADQLAALKAGLVKLKAQRADLPAAATDPAKVGPGAAAATAPAQVGPGAVASTPGDAEPPAVTHEPVTSLPVAKPLKLAAQVRDASGVAWIRVRYRGVTQFEDYKTIDMRRVEQSDTFEAEIPAAEIDPKWDFMYFIEAMDAAGNGCIWPDLLKRTPYVIVHLDRRAATAAQP